MNRFRPPKDYNPIESLKSVLIKEKDINLLNIQDIEIDDNEFNHEPDHRTFQYCNSCTISS